MEAAVSSMDRPCAARSKVDLMIKPDRVRSSVWPTGAAHDDR